MIYLFLMLFFLTLLFEEAPIPIDSTKEVLKKEKENRERE
jgi:hypothetical protein